MPPSVPIFSPGSRQEHVEDSTCRNSREGPSVTSAAASPTLCSCPEVHSNSSIASQRKMETTQGCPSLSCEVTAAARACLRTGEAAGSQWAVCPCRIRQWRGDPRAELSSLCVTGPGSMMEPRLIIRIIAIAAPERAQATRWCREELVRKDSLWKRAKAHQSQNSWKSAALPWTHERWRPSEAVGNSGHP